MEIRKACKTEYREILPLFLDALEEMKYIFFDYKNDEDLLKKFKECFILEEGRYSHKNFTVSETEGKITGILVAYYTSDINLDVVLLEMLKKSGSVRKFFESEFGNEEYYIDSLAVSSEFQRMGTAKKLIEYAESESKSLNCGKMSLVVLKSKERAKKIYENAGYSESGEMSIYGEEYFRMLKNLV